MVVEAGLKASSHINDRLATVSMPAYWRTWGLNERIVLYNREGSSLEVKGRRDVDLRRYI